MADNYLEKKMEDLRMGKNGTSAPRRRLSPGAGKICFDFPTRRVLVAGGCHGIGEAIIDAYLHAGCKVAVFDTDKDKGSAMARDKGIRFYPIDCSDALSPSRPIQPHSALSSALSSAFANLLKAWRNIDIIIINASSPSSPLSPHTPLSIPISPNSAPFSSILPHLWAEHRHRYPIPTDYAGRFILLLPSDEEADIAISDLAPLGITTNILRLAPQSNLPDLADTPTKNAAYSRIISRILLLSLPSASFITGMDIPTN